MLIETDTERQKLTDIHGDVWNTTELQRDFSVESFLAPLVIVTMVSAAHSISITGLASTTTSDLIRI